MRFLYILVGLLSFLAALLFTLPAEKALSWWGGDLKEVVQLYAPQGGITSGEASAVSIDGFYLDKTDWSLKPLSLLKGRIGYDLYTGVAKRPAQAVVELGLGGKTHIHGLQASASILQLLPLFGAPLLPIEALVSADMSYLLMADEKLSAATGTVRVQNAEWRLARPALKLGAFEAQVTTEDGVITAEISNEETAAVDAKGRITLDESGRYNVDLLVRANRLADPRLANLIKGLGRADAQGWYRVKHQGQL